MPFDFIVSCGENIILKETRTLAGLEEAWDAVAQIAETIDQPGARIRVRDEKGDVAIMVGIVIAKTLARDHKAVSSSAPRRGRASRPGPSQSQPSTSPVKTELASD